jgi:hypothetical protein
VGGGKAYEEKQSADSTIKCKLFSLQVEIKNQNFTYEFCKQIF